jgi:putative ABC transport system ATP-binding protein
VAETIGCTNQSGGALTFNVSAGQLVAVAGPSGSGKTTLLSIVAGLRQATCGTATVAGTFDVFTTHASTAPGIRVRELLVLSGTLGQLQPAATQEHVDHLMGAAGIESLAARYVDTLSGGERQRVALLRTLIGGAELVLADEPTSQLDEHHAERVARLLRAHAAAGRGLLVTTHDQRVMNAADLVITLDPN